MEYVTNKIVFPTPVGMNRWYPQFLTGWQRVPHARGDEPPDQIIQPWQFGCSPRPWG